MKNTLALSILKVEGIGEQSSCFIIVEEKLLEMVSIYDTQINENCVELPLKGELKILVKSSSKAEKVQCSVAINIEALPYEGMIWLPLYSGTCLETLPQIPSCLPMTKILISVNQLSLLTPVPEITEYDSSLFDIENSLYNTFTGKNNTDNQEKYNKTIFVINEKNKDLRKKIVELENKIMDNNEIFSQEKKKFLHNNHECFSKLAVQLEKYKSQCENLIVIHEDHLKQIDTLQILFKQENLQREYLEKKITQLNSDFQTYSRLSEEKLIFYQQQLENKSAEIKLLQESHQFSLNFGSKSPEEDTYLQNVKIELHSCIEKLQESEYQRKNLQKKLESVSEYHSKELEELIKFPLDPQDSRIAKLSLEIKELKKKCMDYENLLDDKYVEIKTKENKTNEKSEEHKSKDSEINEEIKTLKELLAQEKKISQGLLLQLREKNCKEIEGKVKCADEKFVDHLKNYGIDDKFEKVADGVFMYEGKKVSVAIKNGCLICRQSGGYLGIEKFIRNFLQEKEECVNGAHKRSQTAAILKDKSPREDYSSKSKDRKLVLTKSNLNTKENAEDITNYSKTVKNKPKEKSLKRLFVSSPFSKSVRTIS